MGVLNERKLQQRKKILVETNTRKEKLARERIEYNRLKIKFEKS